MTTETGPEKAPRRPPGRLFRTVVPVILGTLAILITIRATSLLGLPEIGEPFDIEEFSRPIPDESNAFVVYKQAFAKLGKQPEQVTTIWATSSSLERRWLEENREALEMWKKGTTRPDALYISPKTINIGTLLPVIQGMRDFSRMASLEGTRLEAEGNMAGALDWYIAMLRSSRHCGRRGVPIERLVGVAIGAVATNRLLAWAIDPRVDAAMLRRALDSVIEADAMTPPSSDSFKCEYISFMNTIADPVYLDPAKLIGNPPSLWSSGPGQTYFRAERSIKQEPERSRRVYRLMVANLLAYCDRPRSTRPPLANLTQPPASLPPGVTAGFDLYVPESDAPASLKVLTPDQLAGWFHATLYAKIFSPNFSAMDKALRRDRGTFGNLHITLANELCKREKGQYPDKVEDLVGPYLKALPEGYASAK